MSIRRGILEYAKKYLLAWQDMAFAHGFTAVGDAGVELNYKDNAEAYVELEQEEHKLWVYCRMTGDDI